MNVILYILYILRLCEKTLQYNCISLIMYYILYSILYHTFNYIKNLYYITFILGKTSHIIAYYTII